MHERIGNLTRFAWAYCELVTVFSVFNLSLFEILALSLITGKLERII